MDVRAELNRFFACQLERWPLAAANYMALNKVESKEIAVTGCEVPVKVVFNTARAVSTAANLSTQAIAMRKCFLCGANRPAEQEAFMPLSTPEYELLVNPFPIVSPHYTVAWRRHTPQTSMPLNVMCDLACALPEMVAFFNGAKAGASAPDHLHCQMVRVGDVPLISYLHRHGASGEHQVDTSSGVAYPADFFHGDYAGKEELMGEYLSLQHRYPSLSSNNPLLNAFVWREAAGRLHFVIIPRRCHRPSVYNMSEDEGRLLVSPGALDVAGLVVTVRRDDFERLDGIILKKIFKETCMDKTC